MGIHIDKLYNEFDTAKEHILTKEATKKYEELSSQWKMLTKGLTNEEKVAYICLRVLFIDFLNTCCKDHFSKGFESGINVTYKLTNRFLTPFDDEDDDEYDNDNK